MTITSFQNPRVKNAVHLRDRRQREKHRRIVIDGARELLRAIDVRVRLVEAFVCEPLCRSTDAHHALDLLRGPSGNPRRGPARVRETGVRRQGGRSAGRSGNAGHRARSPYDENAHTTRNADVLAGCVRAGSRGVAPLVAVLEAVEKPGNMGAVLRSAEGAGVSAVIVADSRTDLYNPNAIRASLGTIFTLPLAAATAGETLAWLQARRFTICAARVDGSHLYTEIDYRRSTAIVLGCEAEGLSDTWRGEDLQTVRLPMLGAADSLNLSATAAVLFYEAFPPALRSYSIRRLLQ